MIKFLLAIVLVAFFSCKKDGVNNTNRKLYSISISNSSNLFITSDKSGNKLYGLRSKSLINKSASISASNNSRDSEVFEVKYYDDLGEEIVKSNPTQIFNLTNYIILVFDNFEAYFVSKRDEKVFEIPLRYLPHYVENKYTYLSQYLNTIDKIQEDGNNNIYYTTYESSSPHKKTLYKVSLSNSSLLQYEEVSAVNDDINGFCVDVNGNISYGYRDNKTQEYKYRYRKADGSFVSPNFPSQSNYNRVWIGTDGNMYGIQSNVEGNIHHKNSYFGKIENGIFSKIKLINMDLNDWKFGEVFKVKGQLFHAYYDYNPNKLFNISNEHDYAEISCAVEPNYVINDDLYYFDKVKFILTLINIKNGSTSHVFDLDENQLGNFDIDKILKVSIDGVVFSGVDLSNGQYVVSTLDINNELIKREVISGEIKTFIALN